MAKEWNIRSGPSKFDVMQGLFQRTGICPHVEFKLQEAPGSETQARVVFVRLVSQKESSENPRELQLWGFVGYMRRGNDVPKQHRGGLDLVIGEYSTETREGTLTQFTLEEAEKTFDKLRALKLF